MDKVTHRTLPPFTVRVLGDMPVLAATGATATAALFVVATRKGEAQASSPWSGNVSASRSAARTDEEGRVPGGRSSAGLREPEHALPKGMDQEAHGGSARYAQEQNHRRNGSQKE
eukprot:6184613-Pleurochrysis_carterae.AAC.2